MTGRDGRTGTAGAPGAPGTTLDTSGPAAPPRSNGELVFAEPWEGRAFGMAVTLAESGLIGWDGFRDRLVARIAEDLQRAYYVSWLAALEDVLVGAGRIGVDDLGVRAARLADRPAGHDHGQGDGHGDGQGHGHAHGHGHGHGRPA